MNKFKKILLSMLKIIIKNRFKMKMKMKMKKQKRKQNYFKPLDLLALNFKMV